MKNKAKIASYIFYFGITIELFFMMYNLGAWEVPTWMNLGRIMQFTAMCFGLKILLTSYSKEEKMIIIIGFVVGILSFFTTNHDMWVIRVVLMIAATKNIDSMRATKYIFYFSLIGCILIMTLSFLGIGMPLVNAIDYGRGVGVENRWCFGMGHPNHFHGLICYLISLGLYIYHEKCNWIVLVILSALNIGLYFLTISRSGILVTELVILAFFVYQYVDFMKNNKIWFILGLFTVISIYLLIMFVVFYGVDSKPIMMKISDLSSGRLLFIHKYGEPEKWLLFGKSDTIDIGIIDVAYAKIMKEYGYLICFVYIIFCCYLIQKLYKENNIAGIIIMMSCAVWGIFENYINAYFLLYNLVWILAFRRS